MKKDGFVRGNVWTICFLMGCIVSLWAQNTMQDSLRRAFSERRAADDTHGLRLGGVLVPAALVDVSALCVDNGWLKNRREDIQDVLSA